MQNVKSTKKINKKLVLLTAISALLTAVLVLSGVGIYLKVTHKEKNPIVEVNPLGFSIDTWDGTIEAINFNEDYAGRGTQTKTINSAASFAHFINEVNNGNDYAGYTIYLNSSIDLNGRTINPIGTVEHPFRGIFDGGHYTIYNANLNGNGLFGVTENATIKNVGLYNCSASLINKAINTDIENCFVRLGNGNIANEYISNNGKHHIRRVFVDNGSQGLIGKLNTNNSSEKGVVIADSYYTNGSNEINEKIGEVYYANINTIKATEISDFENWEYSSEYDATKKWCDYDYLEGSKKLSFNYPVQSGFVKTYLTGSCYESVVKVGSKTMDTTNLAEAFKEADKEAEAEVNLLVEKIFMEAQAEVSNAEVKINALKDTTIVRGENNEESMFVGNGTSKIVLGEETNTRSATATLTLDGNREQVETAEKESSALIVANGSEVEIHNNVVIKNNINNTVGYGGAVILNGVGKVAKINATFENCHSTNGGGAMVVVNNSGKTIISTNNKYINCTTEGKGGALYITNELPNEAAAEMARLYGVPATIRPMDEINSQTRPTGDITSSDEYVGCEAEEGGAIYYNGAEGLTISGSPIFMENRATNYGGAIYATGGGLSITGEPQFGYNYAKYKGGAIYATTVSISGSSIFAYNGCYQDPDNGNIMMTDFGGAIYASNVNIGGSPVFGENVADFQGGAIYAENLEVGTNCSPIFEANYVIYSYIYKYNMGYDPLGGAVYCTNSVTLNGSPSFTQNEARIESAASEDQMSGGGAIFTEGKVTISGDAHFEDNGATYGGAVVCFGNDDATIEISGNPTFYINEAYLAGAIATVNLTISGSPIFDYNNSSEYGAVYAVENIIISGSPILKRNSAGGVGNAIYCEGAMEISGNFILNNNYYSYPLSVGTEDSEIYCGGLLTMKSDFTVLSTELNLNTFHLGLDARIHLSDEYVAKHLQNKNSAPSYLVYKNGIDTYESSSDGGYIFGYTSNASDPYISKFLFVVSNAITNNYVLSVSKESDQSYAGIIVVGTSTESHVGVNPNPVAPGEIVTLTIADYKASRTFSMSGDLGDVLQLQSSGYSMDNTRTLDGAVNTIQFKALMGGSVTLTVNVGDNQHTVAINVEYPDGLWLSKTEISGYANAAIEDVILHYPERAYGIKLRTSDNTIVDVSTSGFITRNKTSNHFNLANFLTMKEVGSAKVYIDLYSDENTLWETKSILVTVDSVSSWFNHHYIEVAVGEAIDLTATIYSIYTVTCSSSNSNIVYAESGSISYTPNYMGNTSSISGYKYNVGAKLTAKAPGVVKITAGYLAHATLGLYYSSYAIVKVYDPAESIEVSNKEVEAMGGGEINVSLIIPEKHINGYIKITSENSDIVTAPNGVLSVSSLGQTFNLKDSLTAKAQGTTNVKVALYADSDCIVLVDSQTIAISVETLTLSATTYKILTNQSVDVEVNVAQTYLTGSIRVNVGDSIGEVYSVASLGTKFNLADAPFNLSSTGTITINLYSDANGSVLVGSKTLTVTSAGVNVELSSYKVTTQINTPIDVSIVSVGLPENFGNVTQMSYMCKIVSSDETVVKVADPTLTYIAAGYNYHFGVGTNSTNLPLSLSSYLTVVGTGRATITIYFGGTLTGFPGNYAGNFVVEVVEDVATINLSKEEETIQYGKETTFEYGATKSGIFTITCDNPSIVNFTYDVNATSYSTYVAKIKAVGVGVANFTVSFVPSDGTDAPEIKTFVLTVEKATLATPTNLQWVANANGAKTIASWDPVYIDGVEIYYEISIICNGVGIDTRMTDRNSYDCSQYFAENTGAYTFKIVAVSDSALTSMRSEFSSESLEVLSQTYTFVKGTGVAQILVNGVEASEYINVEGEVITITAILETGYAFTNWTFDDATAPFEDANAISTLITSGGGTITANAEIMPVAVTIVSSNVDYGTVSSESGTLENNVLTLNAKYGQSVSVDENGVLIVGDMQVTATPATKTIEFLFSFEGWTGYSATLTSNTMIVANFAKSINRYTINISSSDEDKGTVNKDKVLADYGTPITFKNNELKIGDETVIAQANDTTNQYIFGFDCWESSIASTVNGNVDIIAHFTATLNSHIIKFAIDPPNFGTISISPEVENNEIEVVYGTEIVLNEDKTLTIGEYTITAIAAEDPTGEYTYTFTNWSNHEGSVTEGRTIVANFTNTTNAYLVTFTADPIGYGTVNNLPTTSVSVLYNSAVSYSEANKELLTIGDQIITARPVDLGDGYIYSFTGWSVESGTKITSDTEIIARFDRTEDVYEITYDLVIPDAEAKGNPETYTINSDTITLNSPTHTNDAYTFIGWISEDITTPTIGVQIVKGSMGDKHFTAVWTVDVDIISNIANNNTYKVSVYQGATKLDDYKSSFTLIYGETYIFKVSANLISDADNNAYQIVRIKFNGSEKFSAYSPNETSINESTVMNNGESNITVTDRLTFEFDYLDAYMMKVFVPEDSIFGVTVNTVNSGNNVILYYSSANAYIISKGTNVTFSINSVPASETVKHSYVGLTYVSNVGSATIGTSGGSAIQFVDFVYNTSYKANKDVGVYYYAVVNGVEISELRVDTIITEIVEIVTSAIPAGGTVTIESEHGLNKVIDSTTTTVMLYEGEWKVTDGNLTLENLRAIFPVYEIKVVDGIYIIVVT